MLLILALLVTCAQPTANAAPLIAATPAPTRHSLVNLAHLNFLSEEIEIDGTPMILTHIYSEYPRYEWVDASGEGIAAVDDVARAAIVYLDHYVTTKDTASLERARRCLNFVRYMQAEDGSGEFYNFITDRKGTINRDGITSYKSLDWWAMRGLWALARGYAVLKDVDAAYASSLREAYLTTERAVQASITNAGQTIKVHGIDVPAWLPGGAADRTGVAVLALAEFHQAEPNTQTAQLLTTLADGLAAFQLGGPGEYPFGMHPDTINAPGFWHAWGSHQSQALAFAGRVMKNRAWIDSAAREAKAFYAMQLAGGLIKEVGVVPVREGQIAYGVNMLVQAYMNLHHATGDAEYARMGGLAASWFLGNNFADTPMYDPQTGRGFDGIDAALKVNQNAGAESTIEALMALGAVQAVPEAARYLQYKAVSHALGWRVIEAEAGTEVAGKPVYGRRGWTGEANVSGGRYYELKPGDVISVAINAPTAGEYWLYASHMRRAAVQPQLRVEAVPAAQITVDAKFDDWVDAPPASADKPEQLLRGAQYWRGPERDSFNVRAMWDANALYLALDVRDSQLKDDTAGPSGQDAMWVYLDGRGDGARLSAKFTLGHAEQGARAWDWRAGFWLPKAQAAWRPTQNGYAYEAVIPWASLGVREARPGANMRLDVGRGVGGNSFMSLSGRDPDSASNLVPMTLVAEAGKASATRPVTGTPPVTSTASRSTAPDAVAFAIAINGATPITVSQASSPDRDYLWLDRISAEPLRLNAGVNTARVTYAGADTTRAALVDAFVLMPMVITREFTGPDNTTLILSYETSTAGLTWSE